MSTDSLGVCSSPLRVALIGSDTRFTSELEQLAKNGAYDLAFVSFPSVASTEGLDLRQFDCLVCLLRWVDVEDATKLCEYVPFVEGRPFVLCVVVEQPSSAQADLLYALTFCADGLVFQADTTPAQILSQLQTCGPRIARMPLSERCLRQAQDALTRARKRLLFLAGEGHE